MPPEVIGQLPLGAYILDCSPYGPPKLLRVDPKLLSPEERMRICRGIQNFEVHPDFKLMEKDDQKFAISPLEKGDG